MTKKQKAIVFGIARIAAGKAFLRSNVIGFRVIAAWLLIISVVRPLLQFLLFECFRADIPKEMSFHPGDLIWGNWPLLLAGLVVGIVSFAFKKGYDLEQEQSLTV